MIIINVQDFWAKGDGITDDTDAIQKAINACMPSKVVEGTLAPIIDDPQRLLSEARQKALEAKA